MQIQNITSIAPISSGPAAQAAPRPAKPAAVASPDAAPQTTAKPATSPAPSAAVPARGSSSHPAPAQNSSGAAEEDALAAVYSTTVGGKSYSGSVDESGGEYSASVPNLPGATATGSSVQAAENNLTLKIDTLA